MSERSRIIILCNIVLILYRIRVNDLWVLMSGTPPDFHVIRRIVVLYNICNILHLYIHNRKRCHCRSHGKNLTHKFYVLIDLWRNHILFIHPPNAIYYKPINLALTTTKCQINHGLTNVTYFFSIDCSTTFT